MNRRQLLRLGGLATVVPKALAAAPAPVVTGSLAATWAVAE